MLTHDEIRKFWTATKTLPLEMQAFWRLRLLTAQRKSEVQNMVWTELDLKEGVWTIPGERSKNGKSHRVPLAPPVLVLLNDLREREDGRLAKMKKPPKHPQVFVLRQARGMRQQREAAATFKLTDFRGHDLRRTAASLMTGSGTSRLVVSKILNHAEGGVTSVYDRHSYDSEKRVALDSWARTLTQILEKKEDEPTTVVAFARA